MKRSMVLVTLVLTIVLLSQATVAGAPPADLEFRAATVEQSLDYCFGSHTDIVRFEFDMMSGPLWTHVMYMPFTEADEGNYLWWTASDTNFDVHTGLLTNGEPNITLTFLQNPLTGQGGGGVGYQTEAVFLGDQVGPNGVDLQGFTINRIGLLFDQIDIWPTPSGSCVNVHGVMVFTQLATRDACKAGGWKYLERMDGTSFKNQGDCIQYASTGK